LIRIDCVLFSKKKKKNPQQTALKRFILSRFGYRPKDITYFEWAITHPSALDKEHDHSYERLEFLGDTIVDAIVAEYVFKKYPTENEGFLTQHKSRIVSRKVHIQIANKMNLRQILRYKRDNRINVDNLSGNAFEAIIGAIYLDAGFEQARTSLLQYVFRKFADINKLLEAEADFKSRLIIWCQQRKLDLKFIIEKSVQKPNSTWMYWIEVEINNKRYGKGSGVNKKDAQQNAAKETLSIIEQMGGVININDKK